MTPPNKAPAQRKLAKPVKRRLTVRWGETDLNHTGYTAEISEGELYIVTNAAPPASGRIHMQLFLDDRRCVYLEGLVVRWKDVPPELRSAVHGGIGVRLLDPKELLADLMPRDAPAIQHRFNIAFDSEESLRRVMEREVESGGLFLPTCRKLAPGSDAVIEMRLDFAGGTLEFPVTVLQSTEATAGRPPGLVFMFKNRDDVIATLAPLAGG